MTSLERKRYHISLTSEERKFLKKYVSTGKHTARNITRARIILLSSEGKKGSEIVKNPGIYQVRLQMP